MLSSCGGLGRRIVTRLGGHPAAELGLDLDRDEDLGRWLVAACLRGAVRDEDSASRGFAALREAGMDALPALEAAGLARIDAALQKAGLRKTEPLAGRLVRVGQSLAERHGGSLERLLGDADSLEACGAALMGLAPGLGQSTTAAFLRPLRDRVAVAGEVPLAPPARAAAVHLGWLDELIDAEMEAAGLRSALEREDDAPPLADVEAALERLGRAACQRNRPARCPLAADCPARGGAFGDVG